MADSSLHSIFSALCSMRFACSLSPRYSVLMTLCALLSFRLIAFFPSAALIALRYAPCCLLVCVNRRKSAVKFLFSELGALCAFARGIFSFKSQDWFRFEEGQSTNADLTNHFVALQDLTRATSDTTMLCLFDSQKRWMV